MRIPPQAENTSNNNMSFPWRLYSSFKFGFSGLYQSDWVIHMHHISEQLSFRHCLDISPIPCYSFVVQHGSYRLSIISICEHITYVTNSCICFTRKTCNFLHFFAFSDMAEGLLWSLHICFTFSETSPPFLHLNFIPCWHVDFWLEQHTWLCHTYPTW